MRKLSKYILRKPVIRWGRLNHRFLVVVFCDGNAAVVDPEDGTYRAIKSWNWQNRTLYLNQAIHTPKEPTPLAKLLERLGYEVKA